MTELELTKNEIDEASTKIVKNATLKQVILFFWWMATLQSSKWLYVLSFIGRGMAVFYAFRNIKVHKAHKHFSYKITGFNQK